MNWNVRSVLETAGAGKGQIPPAAAALHYTHDTVCTLSAVHCKLCTVQCTPVTDHWSLYTVYCILYNVNCRLKPVY